MYQLYDKNRDRPGTVSYTHLDVYKRQIQGRRPSIWKPFDKNVPFSDRADSVIAWLQLPEEVRPHLIMWYMEEPDGVGHRATPDSSATLSTVEHLDRILGDFFAEARRLDIFDQIDFIVLSDHGMATYYPENYVNPVSYTHLDVYKRQLYVSGRAGAEKPDFSA